MKNPSDLDPASPISIFEGLKLKSRYAKSAGTKTAASSIALPSNSEFAMNARRSVVRIEISESVPDNPSIPSVAFVALIETTKRITARM